MNIPYFNINIPMPKDVKPPAQCPGPFMGATGPIKFFAKDADGNMYAYVDDEWKLGIPFTF